MRFSQGFLTVSQTCGRCRGEGRIVEHPCQTCRGLGQTKAERTLTVKIPAGVETGTRLKLAGEGEAGVRGGPPGDLYVVVVVKEHPLFTRHGDDIYCEVPVSFSQAALGAQIEIPTISGRATLKIPPGTQTGAEFRMRGKGFPNVRGYGQGDLLARIFVEVPDASVGQAARPAGTVRETGEQRGEPAGSGVLGQGQGPLRVRPAAPWDARITDDSSSLPRG